MAELEAKNAELKSKCLGETRGGGRSYGEQPPQRSAEFCGAEMCCYCRMRLLERTTIAQGI